MAPMPPPAERRRRALDRGLFLAERVARVAATTWLVPSQTDPEDVRAVALIDGYLRCDCYASLAGRPCAHKAAICLLLLAGPPSEAAKSTPAQAVRRSA